MRVGAGAEIQMEVYMIEGKEESLLGQEDAEALGIVTIRAEGEPVPEPARETTRERETEQGSLILEGLDTINRWPRREDLGRQEKTPTSRKDEKEQGTRREQAGHPPGKEGRTGRRSEEGRPDKAAKTQRRYREHPGQTRPGNEHEGDLDRAKEVPEERSQPTQEEGKTGSMKGDEERRAKERRWQRAGTSARGQPTKPGQTQEE